MANFDFGNLTTAGRKKLEQAANQIKQSGTDKGISIGSKSASVESIFSGSTSEISGKELIEALSGSKVDDLGKAQKAQYDLIAALSDADGDGKITQKELSALDLSGDGKIAQDDINSLYSQLGLGTTASIDQLMNEINGILNDTDVEESTNKAAIPSKSGAVYDSKTGEYSLTVETYRDGRVQDDGEGGKRYPNGSLWGIVTNAYPNVSEGEKEKVYKMMAEVNGWDEGWEKHGLYTGDKVKLPILEFDSNGNVSGYKAANKVEAPKTSTAAKTSTSTPAQTKVYTTPAKTTAAKTSTSTPAQTKVYTTPARTNSLSDSQKTEYNDMIDNAKKIMEDCVKENNFSKFATYADKNFKSGAITNDQKSKLFDEYLKMLTQAAEKSDSSFAASTPYDFIKEFGDSKKYSFMTPEHKADAIKNTFKNDKLQLWNSGVDVVNDHFYSTMNELLEKGNIDKFLEMNKVYNDRYGENSLSYHGDGYDWAEMTSKLYVEAAKQGKLNKILDMKDFDTFKGFQDKVERTDETNLEDAMFKSLQKQLPTSVNASQADMDYYETKLLSGSIRKQLENVLNSDLDDKTKAYLLNRVMSNDNFTNEFRNIKDNAFFHFDYKPQEELLQKMMRQIAKYTDAK